VRSYERVVGDGVSVRVSFPESWTLTPKPVASLHLPRQVFGISTVPIKVRSKKSDDWWPDLSEMSFRDILIWSYYSKPMYTAPGVGTVRSPVPDFDQFSIPLSYADSITYSQYQGRGWPEAKFLWRKLGVNYAKDALTVQIWEGTAATEESVRMASEIVSSIRILS
jgi:hypothetical protein